MSGLGVFLIFIIQVLYLFTLGSEQKYAMLFNIKLKSSHIYIYFICFEPLILHSLRVLEALLSNFVDFTRKYQTSVLLRSYFLLGLDKNVSLVKEGRYLTI